MTAIIKLRQLQDQLWKILTPNNNCQPDRERIADAEKLIREFIDSEPINTFCKTIYKCPEEPNRCSSCEFWKQHKRSGTCSQKVRLDMGKWDYQFTSEDYGCTTYEERGTVDYTI